MSLRVRLELHGIWCNGEVGEQCLGAWAGMQYNSGEVSTQGCYTDEWGTCVGIICRLRMHSSSMEHVAWGSLTFTSVAHGACRPYLNSLWGMQCPAA